jgi:hypothetical protein
MHAAASAWCCPATSQPARASSRQAKARRAQAAHLRQGLVASAQVARAAARLHDVAGGSAKRCQGQQRQSLHAHGRGGSAVQSLANTCQPRTSGNAGGSRCVKSRWDTQAACMVRALPQKCRLSMMAAQAPACSGSSPHAPGLPPCRSSSRAWSAPACGRGWRGTSPARCPCPGGCPAPPAPTARPPTGPQRPGWRWPCPPACSSASTHQATLSQPAWCVLHPSLLHRGPFFMDQPASPFVSICKASSLRTQRRPLRWSTARKVAASSGDAHQQPQRLDALPGWDGGGGSQGYDGEDQLQAREGSG